MPKVKGDSGIERIAAFLRKNVGKVVTSEQIREASGGQSEHARRVRDLRKHRGWKILTHNDRADLKPGQYILAEKPPEKDAYVFPKTISSRVRAEVLERNGYTCQMCGVGAGEQMDNGRPARLQMGHIIDQSHGGKDTVSNLRALCSQCNQGAKNLVQEPPSFTWLKSQVRRATVNDQKEILKMLKEKFGEA